MALDTIFEKETCGRCGGSGRYSYNQMDGDRCYGCGGKGERLTKRGQAAYRWFIEQMTDDADNLKPGDRVRHEIMAGVNQFMNAPLEFVEAKRDDSNYAKSRQPDGSWKTYTEQMQYIFRRIKNDETVTLSRWIGDSGRSLRVRRILEGEQLSKLREAALAYQRTLTKTGTPRKRAA